MDPVRKPCADMTDSRQSMRCAAGTPTAPQLNLAQALPCKALHALQSAPHCGQRVRGAAGRLPPTWVDAAPISRPCSAHLEPRMTPMGSVRCQSSGCTCSGSFQPRVAAAHMMEAHTLPAAPWKSGSMLHHPKLDQVPHVIQAQGQSMAYSLDCTVL